MYWGNRYEDEGLYEKALNEYLECLRLARDGGAFDVFNSVLFLLIILGRLEDAYGFIKWEF